MAHAGLSTPARSRFEETTQTPVKRIRVRDLCQLLHADIDANTALVGCPIAVNTVQYVAVLEGSDSVLAESGNPARNNIVERALKRAVLHRKNALFYRTLTAGRRCATCS
jgi:hypothetical protein